MNFVNISSSLRNRILFILTFCFCYVTSAQKVEIKDPVLKQFFCDNYSFAMDNDCLLLDTALLNTTITEPQFIEIRGAGMQSADELTYFKAADSIFIDQNELTKFPSDFRALNWFPERLTLNENQLTEAPTYLDNGLTGTNLVGIKLFYLTGNLVQELPSEWDFMTNNRTLVLALNDNQLTDCPNFNGLSEIRRLALFNNYLDFEDLIPIKNNPRYGVNGSNFQLFPQLPFRINFSQFTYSIGSETSISIARNTSGNNYYLLKDSVIIDSNQTGEFTINFSSDDDFGVYSAQIRNDEFTGKNDFLFSEDYVLTRMLNEKNDVIIFSPNGDGLDDDLLIEGKGEATFLNNNGKIVRQEVLPFLWQGDNKKGKTLEPGFFVIMKENGEFLEVLISY